MIDTDLNVQAEIFTNANRYASCGIDEAIIQNTSFMILDRETKVLDDCHDGALRIERNRNDKCVDKDTTKLNSILPKS